ncbi:putative inorganic phosphate cotransporter [Cimex lectularius]|uniref:Major facilitator superfamily (MFS) profile domain-containing protein n=1 Tax=Cimex lectularius TaxID=79782 RepID=A0A8I6SCQ4_CIMLE|nr:putative inorganic phosphate cotransporter [Cimex lectularius]
MQFVIPLHRIPHRVLVSIEAFFALAISYMMRFCTSIALTEMTKPTKSIKDSTCNITTSSFLKPLDKLYDFNWSARDISFLQSSFFAGYALSMIPSGILADKIGFKTPVVVGLLISGLSTVLQPFFAYHHGVWGMILLRFILGMAQGLFYAALHTMVAEWVPKKERSVLGTIIFSGLYIGNAINFSCSGNILWFFKGSWPILFYLYGSSGIFIGVIFLFTTYNRPEDNPYLKPKEKKLLTEHINSMKLLKPEQKNTPCVAIMTNNPVWSISIAMFGHNWCLFLMITALPTFISAVLNYNSQQNGLINASIHLIIWVAGILSGVLCDYAVKKRIVSLTMNRKIGATLASIMPSVGILLSAYTRCNRLASIVLIAVGTFFMGCFYPTLKMNPIDIAQNFAGTIGAMAHFCGALAGILVTLFTTQFTPNNSMDEWKGVFWICFIIMSLTNMHYIIFASADIQTFDTMQKK